MTLAHYIELVVMYYMVYSNQATCPSYKQYIRI